MVFFFTFETKNGDRKAIWSMGVPSVWGGKGDSEEKLFWWGPVRKYVPNACFWELLVWSGMIWGRFGVILVILECRLTVCYKTICQIRLRLNASVVSKRLQNVCISRPESWIFCIKIDDDFQWLNYKDRMAKCHQCRKKEEVGVAFVSLVPATHWTPTTLWARSWLWRTCWPLARCSFTISVRESTRNHGVEGSPL